MLNEIYDRDERLEQALSAVQEMEPDFEKALIDYANAETNYRVRKAEEYLKAEGSIQAREATAIVAVKQLLETRNRAEAVRDFLKAKMKDRQDAVSARQTLLNSEKQTSRAFTG